MGIIIKFILQNLREKKFRTFLILISVALSAALFFASWALSGTIKQMFLERMKQYYGDADIIVHANQKSPSRYFRPSPAARFLNRLHYGIGAMEDSATYQFGREIINLNLKGFDLRELQVMNPVRFSRKLSALAGAPVGLYPFHGNKIIVSRITAQNYRWRIGQSINLQLAGGKKRFRIVAIAHPVGIFQDDGRTHSAVIPKEALAAFHDVRGHVTVLFLKAKNPAEIGKLLREMTPAFKRFTVREPFSQAELDQETSSVTTPFFIMLLSVVAMSIFIIYTSFKVITRERLPLIGTFRSVGATRRTTSLVLFAESILYGVVGGLLGCGLGIGVLYVMAGLMKSPWMQGVKTTLQFSAYQLLAAFLVAVFLAFVSAAFPIIRTARIPVKDLVLNSWDKQGGKQAWKLPLGAIFLSAGVSLPHFAPKSWAMPIDMGCLLLIVTAIVMLIPHITSVLINLLSFFYQYLFQNEGVLAVKNLRQNKSVLNNISLLSIGISSLLMINIVSQSVGMEVLNVWRAARFDIWMGMGGAGRQTQGVVAAVDGVQAVYGMYDQYGVDLPDYHSTIGWLVGAHPQRYPDFWDFGIAGNPRRVLTAMDKGRNILLTVALKQKLGLNRGDTITLQTKRGRRAYRVAGFFNTLWQNGSCAIIPERYYKTDMMERYYNSILIKTDIEAAAVEKNIKKKFQRESPFVMTVKAMEARNITSNAQMFLILQGFSFLALIIGVFGVLNNLLISFLERRRSLAMFRSVGMSRRQMLKMILIESLTGGLIGGLVGIGGGMLTVAIIPQVLQSINLPQFRMHYSGLLILNSLLGGVIITVLAAIGPAAKTSRLNLSDALKYE